MAFPSSLLESVRGLLERTYRIETGLADIGPFVIGDRGYRRFYARRRLYRTAGTATDDLGAQTLVRESGEEVLACIYFPDAMIRQLETHPPQRGISELNVDPFAAFVEEIDHLLLVAERTQLNRPLTLLEMELHANVSKYLVLSRFLAGRRGRFGSRERIWLKHHLFEKGDFRDDEQAVRQRYREAAHWAVRFLDRLVALNSAARIDTLRRFHDAGSAEKLRLIQTWH